MTASLITRDPDMSDVEKYFRALKKGQRDIDLRPDLYTHYYKKEFPVRFHATVDTRRSGPGERLVFKPYTKDVFDKSFEWIAEHGIFPEGAMGSGKYERLAFQIAAHRRSPPILFYGTRHSRLCDPLLSAAPVLGSKD
jgi:hypothetical protein